MITCLYILDLIKQIDSLAFILELDILYCLEEKRKIEEKYDSIYDKIRHLINVKDDITYINSHNYETIKVASYNPLPLVKAMTICNAIIFFNSVWNKGKNNYWYKKVCSCKNKN